MSHIFHTTTGYYDGYYGIDRSEWYVYSIHYDEYKHDHEQGCEDRHIVTQYLNDRQENYDG